jgi:hypothetical protein
MVYVLTRTHAGRQLMIIISGSVKILLPGTKPTASKGDVGYLLTLGPG